MDPIFEQSVFLNCPFDEDFAPILQAVAFCITDLGLMPRLAPENSDNAEGRLERIIALVRTSKFGIHDISRSKSRATGEYARLNMPFELGLDYGSRRFGGAELTQKSILVLEQDNYDSKRALSDIAGWDVEAHRGDYVRAVRIVSRWLIQQTGVPPVGPAKILADYSDFQEWYYERELARGASEEDIQEYPTIDFVRAMQEWATLGKPL